MKDFIIRQAERKDCALFFHNFSTFLGRAGIYLEDLFVLPEYRGNGYGKALLKSLAAITVERGCGRLERRLTMNKWWRFILAVVIAIAVNAIAIGAFILWCKHIEKTQAMIDYVTTVMTMIR